METPKEQEINEAEKRMAIIKKWMALKTSQNGPLDTLFKYNQAMQEYALLMVADKDNNIKMLEQNFSKWMNDVQKIINEKQSEIDSLRKAVALILNTIPPLKREHLLGIHSDDFNELIK